MAAGAGHLAAIDLGTTSVRALVASASGRVLGRARRPLPTRYPEPGRVEQDPLDMVRLSCLALQEALATAGLGARDIAALGLATQRGTAIAWDARTLLPLAPAIGWQDRRAAPRAAELQRKGLPLHSLASATKLEWWLRHEPAVARAAAAGTLRFGTPDAWLTHKLSGGDAFVTDAGEACATGLYDPRAGAWSARLLEALGIDVRWLPRIVATDAPAGETAAPLFGAPLPLAARAGDQQASAFAQAVLRRGEAKLTLGTSAMLDVNAGAALPPPRPGSYPLVLFELMRGGRAFCLEGTVITAGAAVDWLASLGCLEAPERLDAEARRAGDDAGVVFVPALQGLGTPRFDDAARGFIGGLTRGTRREHLARGLVEGLAQRCADLCDSLGPFEGPLRVDGGLSRCDLLLQEIADLSGCELQRAAEPETTALGAALLAAHGAGLLSSADDVRTLLAAPLAFRPRIPADLRAARRTRWQGIVRRAFSADAGPRLGHAPPVAAAGPPGQRILVFVSDRIGDVIFCTPALRLLRESRPGARIEVVVQSDVAADVLRDNPCVDRVLRPDDPALRPGAAPFDLLLDLKNNKVSRALAEGLGAKPAGVIRRHGEDHEAEAAMTVVEQALGAERGRALRGYELFPTAADVARAEALLAAAGVTPDDVLVGCHMGCNRVARRGWKLWKPRTHPKAWPVERFLALEPQLRRAIPRLRLVLTGSAGERDLGRRMLRAAPHAVDLIGRTSVAELFAVAKRLRVFVTADTGPLHVACAAGVPLVALFGATPVSRFGPWPPRADRTVLEGDPVAAIPVETVRDAVLARLASGPAPAG